MPYVDGFMAAVPAANKQAFIDHAIRAGEIFKEYGALAVTECWGDDVNDGKVNSMKSAVLLEEDETVAFSWITWPSKDIRDRAWEKIMEDPRMHEEGAKMPFDGQRMILGGFDVIVDL